MKKEDKIREGQVILDQRENYESLALQISLRTNCRLTFDRLAQLVEHGTAVREVAGSNLDRPNTQGL